MKKRIRMMLTAFAAAVIVPAVVAAATNVYTSPTLRISQAGTVTKITASAAPTDDATARAAIYAPTGTAVTISSTPGTVIGSVNAQVSALDLGGALLPLTGPIVVAPPGAVDPAIQGACTAGQAASAVLILQLSAAGQTINLPAYVVPTAGAEAAIGPVKLIFCLAPPDLPPGTPGRATFGAKFLSAELTLNGVFSVVTTGAWIAFWTPWTPATGQINAAGTVASPAAVAPGAVTAKAKTAAAGAVVSGNVTQSGQPRSNATVSIYGGTTRTKLARLGSVKAKANGSYSFRAKRGTFFQARVVAAAGTASPLCVALTPALGGVPCVNPTVNGFTARSATVKKK